MSRTTSASSRRQLRRARREISRAIETAGTRSLRDELIVLAQRSDLI